MEADYSEMLEQFVPINGVESDYRDNPVFTSADFYENCQHLPSLSVGVTLLPGAGRDGRSVLRLDSNVAFALVGWDLNLAY
ncbi:unnamed protein product [Protopolystoma xenopodis]|uniref:Uncharacterized protein n=1 Tax=Protopolystoma xenopodis TaxID=117903 RepID=A0A3S5BYV2_9PLAT|nr:unnamed protein product [Protopolystoma xenopodis]